MGRVEEGLEEGSSWRELSGEITEIGGEITEHAQQRRHLVGQLVRVRVRFGVGVGVSVRVRVSNPNHNPDPNPNPQPNPDQVGQLGGVVGRIGRGLGHAQRTG